MLIIMFCTMAFEAAAVQSSKLQYFINNFSPEKQGLQGGAIAILSQGKVVYKTTFGYQEGSSRPITEHTLFPLASVSKSVCATAIALLADKSLIDIDRKVHIEPLKPNVSLMNILGHTTGYRFNGNSEVEQGVERNVIMQKVASQKPACKVGECYFYSNAVFSLADEALQTQGYNFASALKNLQKTLKTDEIQLPPLKDMKNFAYPHKISQSGASKALPFPPYYPKTLPTSAGVFASLDGMIHLLQLQMGHRPDVISQGMLDKLYYPYMVNHDIQEWGFDLPKGLTSFYGLGFRRLKLDGHPGQDFIFHSGRIAGISTFIGFMPSEDVGIIVLLNQNSGFGIDTGIALWETLLGMK